MQPACSTNRWIYCKQNDTPGGDSPTPCVPLWNFFSLYASVLYAERLIKARLRRKNSGPAWHARKTSSRKRRSSIYRQGYQFLKGFILKCRRICSNRKLQPVARLQLCPEIRLQSHIHAAPCKMSGAYVPCVQVVPWLAETQLKSAQQSWKTTRCVFTSKAKFSVGGIPSLPIYLILKFQHTICKPRKYYTTVGQ